MAKMTSEQVRDYLEKSDSIEKLCLLHGNAPSPDIAQRIVNIILLRNNITPSKIIKEYADIAEGKTIKKIMNGAGEILTQVDDPAIRLKALDALLDLTGLKDNIKQTKDRDGSIDVRFEELLMEEQSKSNLLENGE